MEVLYRCFYTMLMIGNRRLLLNWTSGGHPLYPRLRLLFEDALGEWSKVRPSRREERD